MNRIITIGREFGSGGRELGRRLAEELEIAYYDREIVTEIVKRTQLAEEYVTDVEESRLLPLMPITIGQTFALHLDPLVQQQQTVFREQTKVIEELADKSDCVIVGRCADYILREQKPFRLFVYADMEARMARCRERGKLDNDLSDRELRRKIIGIDKERARYYRFYTEQEWGEKIYYDLCLNTSGVNMKKAAQALAAFIIRR